MLLDDGVGKRSREEDEEGDLRRLRRRREESRRKIQDNQHSLEKLIQEDAAVTKCLELEMEKKIENLTEALEERMEEIKSGEGKVRGMDEAVKEQESRHRDKVVEYSARLRRAECRVKEGQLVEQKLSVV